MERAARQKPEPHAARVDGHRLIARTLKQLGVTHVYGVSGTPIRETLPACSHVGMRPIGVHHQQAAIMMALAHNYVTGRLAGVSILSAGPAITNGVTSVLVARDNGWPVVVLGGRRPLGRERMGVFQEMDAVPIFQSITKWSATVRTTAEIPAHLVRAFEIATSGRPGPVYLDLPEEALTGTLAAACPVAANRAEVPYPDRPAVARAADILLSAKRPAVIIGKGIRWSEPYEELQRLVNEFALPFLCSPMGRGYLPDDHPLCFNAARGLLQSKADAVLLLGARLDWTFRFGAEFARDAKLIQIDIEPNEIGVNVSATVGIVGDVKEALAALLCELRLHAGAARSVRGPVQSWIAELTERRRKNLDQLKTQTDHDANPMSPHRLMKEIRDVLPHDAICVLDGNVSMAVAQEVLPAYAPASRLTSGSNGCMGVGIPYGIGAKLGRPDRPVVVISGDFAFGLSAMELETAVRHKVPVVVLVVNNEGLSGAASHKALYPPDHERVTMFHPGIRYEQIARAVGAHGECVERPEEIRPALERAMRSGVPACITVKVDPAAPYPRAMA